MSKKKKKKKELVVEKKELVVEPSPPPYFNPRADGDGFISFPGASRKIKTTSISDIFPTWYDHRDP